MATILRTIDEIMLVDVYDRGIPNRERIAYVAQRSLDLGEYVVCLAATLPDDTVTPLPDRMLWLGVEHVERGQWIFVYTGVGERRLSRMENGDPVVVIPWQQRQTILADPRVVPIMFHLDGILTPRSAATLGDIRDRMFSPPISPEAILKAFLAGKPAASVSSPGDDEAQKQMFRRVLESRFKKGPSDTSGGSGRGSAE